LITDIPLIGGVQVYFLTSPEIDFDLGGIANALDAPGLSNIIRKIILEQIGNFIV
jgi:Ca2+-dependent lipid-binding protein